MKTKKLISGFIFSNLMYASRAFLTPGIPFNYTQVENTDNQLLKAMNSEEHQTNQEDINMVKGVNDNKASEVSQLQPTKEQVIGLNINQIRGISYFNLTTEQVENPSYNEDILNTMLALQNAMPQAKGLHLYETAMKMEYYQIRGILKHNLTLEQVDIKISGNRFVQQDSEYNVLEELLKSIQSNIGGTDFQLIIEQQEKAKEKLDEILKYIKESGKTIKTSTPKSFLDSLRNIGTPINKDNKKTPAPSDIEPNKKDQNKDEKTIAKRGKSRKKPKQ